MPIKIEKVAIKIEKKNRQDIYELFSINLFHGLGFAFVLVFEFHYTFPLQF